MFQRKFRVTPMTLAAWTLPLALAAPALAQGEETVHSTSTFGQFFTVDTQLGTGVVWFLFACSVAIVSLIIMNVMKNRAAVFAPQKFVEELDHRLQEKNYREAIELAGADPSPFAQMMHAALGQASRGYGAMEQAMEEVADSVGSQRVRQLVWLEVAGAAGPMMGLFGTVFGMIVTFGKMVASGGAPKPTELAGGIATALVCTFWGLVVGIPGVLFASLFRVKIEGLVAESIFKGQGMLNQFRPGAAKKPAAGPATPKPAATPA